MKYKNSHKNIFFKVRPEILVCLFLVIATLAVYWQVRNHEFINFDDGNYITENHHVKTGLTLENIVWSFTTAHVSNWHPITWLSHMLDCQLYGMNPGRHHLTNLLIHIVNTLLLFLIFRRMTGGLWQSFFVAALFSLHPLHVESVAWVSERKDVLSTFFWMLTMWSYARYVERPELKRYLLALLFFSLGLMTKPMLVTLPFVLLLLDYWPLNRFQIDKSGDDNNSKQGTFVFYLIREKTPFFILSIASSIVTYLVQQSGGAVTSLDAIPFNVRIANALLSYVSYIGKIVWPHNLAVFYPHSGTLPIWESVGAGLLLIFLTVFVVSSRRKFPYLFLGLLWYIGTLVPVIGLVQVGSQAMADRYTYVPLIGISIMFVWFVPEVVARMSRRKILLAVLATLYLSTLMAVTWKQVRYWKNSIALFDHTLNVTANNYIAHHKLGEALAEQNRTAEAIRHYSEALRIQPNFIQTYLNLGDTYASLGNDEDAVIYYNEALQKKPNYEKAHNNLGNVMARQGNFEGAVYHYNEALKINPDYAGAYYNLGKIAANQGKIENAILHYRKSLLLNPIMTEVLYNLSWTFATHKNKKYRNGKEAIKLAKKLCKITLNNQPLALDALAAAYAETGKFDSAVLTAQRALKLALMYGPQELALGLKKRLQLYTARRPYRDL